MNPEMTLKDYISSLSSSSPTPGGGNVSALCGVLSASLGEMVCNLTIGKKKYADCEEELKVIREKLSGYSGAFLSLAGKDNEAFDKVMEAFRMPKESDEEKLSRNSAISEATLLAAKVPAEVVSLCAMTVKLIAVVAEKGNRNSLSDAGVAALLTASASEGAFLNVMINCSSLSGSSEAESLLSSASKHLNETKSASKEILNRIYSKLTEKQ